MNENEQHKKFERTTQEQLKCFLEILRKYPELLVPKCGPLKTVESVDSLWENVAESLNAITGPKRTPAKWRESLRNWKKQLRCRARKANRLRTRRGQYAKNMSLKQQAIEVVNLKSMYDRSFKKSTRNPNRIQIRTEPEAADLESEANEVLEKTTRIAKRRRTRKEPELTNESDLEKQATDVIESKTLYESNRSTRNSNQTRTPEESEPAEVPILEHEETEHVEDNNDDDRMTDYELNLDPSFYSKIWHRRDSSQLGTPPPVNHLPSNLSPSNHLPDNHLARNGLPSNPSSPLRSSRAAQKKDKSVNEVLDIVLQLIKRQEEQSQQTLLQQQQLANALHKVGDGLFAIAEAIKNIGNK